MKQVLTENRDKTEVEQLTRMLDLRGHKNEE